MRETTTSSKLPPSPKQVKRLNFREHLNENIYPVKPIHPNDGIKAVSSNISVNFRIETMLISKPSKIKPAIENICKLFNANQGE